MNSSQRNRVRITRLNSTIITGCMRRDMPRPPAKSGPRLVPHGNRVGTNTHFRHGLGQKAGAAEPAHRDAPVDRSRMRPPRTRAHPRIWCAKKSGKNFSRERVYGDIVRRGGPRFHKGGHPWGSICRGERQARARPRQIPASAVRAGATDLRDQHAHQHQDEDERHQGHGHASPLVQQRDELDR